MTHAEWNALSKEERIELLKRRAETAMRMWSDKFGGPTGDYETDVSLERDGDDELYVFSGKAPCTFRLDTLTDTWTFED